MLSDDTLSIVSVISEYYIDAFGFTYITVHVYNACSLLQYICWQCASVDLYSSVIQKVTAMLTLYLLSSSDLDSGIYWPPFNVVL